MERMPFFLRSAKQILFAFLLMTSSTSTITWAGPIIEGREWLQPADFLGYSWNDFNAVCAGGPCVGSVGVSGPDITGWTWASIFEVGDLFSSGTGHPGGMSLYDSAQASEVFDFLSDTGFERTSTAQQAIDFGVAGVAGFSSTQSLVSGEAFTGFIQAGLFPEFFVGSIISTIHTQPADIATEFYGAWLYRTVNVPSPHSLGLFLLALALLANKRRFGQ